MAIRVGIDASKNKCLATLKRDGNKDALEQITFENRTRGILGHTKSYGEQGVEQL